MDNNNNKKNGTSKIFKLKRQVTINAATILIAAILIYIIGCIFITANKKPITTYKVNNSIVNNDISLEGLIIRNEQVITSPSTGYLCYYTRDEDKVKKSAFLCSIDQTGQLDNMISDAETVQDVLRTNDYLYIRDNISYYKDTYSDVNFYDAYNFNASINNKVYELTNELLMQKLEQNGSTSVSGVKAPNSGLAAYYIDGYENIDTTNISKEYFDKSAYKKQIHKTGDSVTAGDPIIKLITDDTWYIIAPITLEQLSQIPDPEYVRVKLKNGEYSMTVPYAVINAPDGTYIRLKLNKYMSNFISERFIDVSLALEEYSGLKVPVSAIVNKTVYIVPKTLLSENGAMNEINNISIISFDSEGKSKVTNKPVTVYKVEDDMCYIGADFLNPEDRIVEVKPKGDVDDTGNTTYPVSQLQTGTIQGVYRTTRAVAEFRMVNIKKQINEFVLVETGEYLKVYDNIVLDASKVKENQVLY